MIPSKELVECGHIRHATIAFVAPITDALKKTTTDFGATLIL
jgi:hypothetical protein